MDKLLRVIDDRRDALVLTLSLAMEQHGSVSGWEARGSTLVLFWLPKGNLFPTPVRDPQWLTAMVLAWLESQTSRRVFNYTGDGSAVWGWEVRNDVRGPEAPEGILCTISPMEIVYGK